MPTSLDNVHEYTQYPRLFLTRVGHVPLVLIGVWFLTLLWGEHRTYKNAISSCTWHNWETWENTSRPHHVLLVADPQLVDPHTYPGRPWPLSALTVMYTDLYMKRNFDLLLRELQPHSTIFLGDLFDGGREWGTVDYKSPEQRYHGIGQNFWLKEYKRFMNIFVTPWTKAGLTLQPSETGHRLLAGLPGNHDLGFAAGINRHVRGRFDAHFGPLNRVDIIGNHTFVSIDTVSHSAMDEVDPISGAHGAGDASATATQYSGIWRPPENFLIDAPMLRRKQVERELCNLARLEALPINTSDILQQGIPRPRNVENISDSSSVARSFQSLETSTASFPTIILTHVPLYRPEATRCGPLRERGTSISISAGYQYQNVLTPLISKDIVEHLDASQIVQVYSGDDHDYCEVEHPEFSGHIKEITVKSTSWAMGVRRPGVQLVSLWNQIDVSSAISGIPSPAPRDTIQNHLCLLPDQLAIFIRYAQLLGLTLIILVIRGFLYDPKAPSKSESSDGEGAQTLLPLSIKRDRSPIPPPLHQDSSTESSTCSTTHHSDDRLNTTSRKCFPGQSQPQLSSYGQILSFSPSSSPQEQIQPYPSSFTERTTQADSDDWGMPTTARDRIVYVHAHNEKSQRTYLRRLGRTWLISRSTSGTTEFFKATVRVGLPVMVLYLYMLWYV